KFQTYSGRTLYSTKTPSFDYLAELTTKLPHELLEDISLPRAWQAQLAAYCKERGIEHCYMRCLGHELARCLDRLICRLVVQRCQRFELVNRCSDFVVDYRGLAEVRSAMNDTMRNDVDRPSIDLRSALFQDRPQARRVRMRVDLRFVAIHDELWRLLEILEVRGKLHDAFVRRLLPVARDETLDFHG
ncbi:MAG: N-acetylneuraminate synthase family protein, partial [Clostridia bacterium]|nr:N-acetylneuraminate synthase family protein [Deltaproteobacteria bacterium]